MGAIENGGKLQPSTMQLGYTKEQVDAVQRLKNAKNDWERLGLYPGASKYVSLYQTRYVYSLNKRKAL